MLYLSTRAGGSNSKRLLAWETRLKIAVGMAQGLSYLHTMEKPVIFRDFKSSNILLDAVNLHNSWVTFQKYFKANNLDIRNIHCNTSYIYLTSVHIKNTRCKCFYLIAGANTWSFYFCSMILSAFNDCILYDCLPILKFYLLVVLMLLSVLPLQVVLLPDSIKLLLTSNTVF